MEKQNGNLEDKEFRKILEHLEADVGLSEVEVARRLNVPRSTYRSWKDGTCEPSKRVYWQRLSKVFGCDLYFLIYGRRDIDSDLRRCFVSLARYIDTRIS